MNEDTNAIIYAYLVTQATLTNLIGGATPRIYCPRLPENATLPAVSFFTRGGTSNPHIKPIPTPSIQFNCWALDYRNAPTHASIRAREIYRALYDVFQGLQDQDVVVGGTTYRILSAMEETQGQDMVDVEIPEYFYVLTFFSVMIRADT